VVNAEILKIERIVLRVFDRPALAKSRTRTPVPLYRIVARTIATRPPPRAMSAVTSERCANAMLTQRRLTTSLDA
jgi:hypothetical protein